MARRLLIVQGYSDGSASFTALGDFLIEHGVYDAADVSYLDYVDMDDETTFHDFAYQLDMDHRLRLQGERIDIVCHSTGALVVRAWLALHAEQARRRGIEEPCPVDRLVCLAPANFGSDLAVLGQSFLGKFRSTFFNSHSHPEELLESGRLVLRGLEPASPFQWDLSFNYDLHGPYTYFSDRREEWQRCYPFVLAAGEAYSGPQAKLVKERAIPGTDGTVRIAGTSLNTRGCSLDFRLAGPHPLWWRGSKFERIPFAVFAGFNHDAIVDPATRGFMDPEGPGTLVLAILGTQSTTLAEYRSLADRFDAVSEANYARMPTDSKWRYQQFFFRVRDDVDQLVEDYFIDFYVEGHDGTPDKALTLKFEEYFEPKVTAHSTTKSHRVLMMNCSRVDEFRAALKMEQARLVLEVAGVSSLPSATYETTTTIAFDPAVPTPAGEPCFLCPNTTTLIDVILNRINNNRLLIITPPVGGAPLATVTPLRERSGRAVLWRTHQ